jgi:hypothetical protein
MPQLTHEVVLRADLTVELLKTVAGVLLGLRTPCVLQALLSQCSERMCRLERIMSLCDLEREALAGDRVSALPVDAENNHQTVVCLGTAL